LPQWAIFSCWSPKEKKKKEEEKRKKEKKERKERERKEKKRFRIQISNYLVNTQFNVLAFVLLY